MTKVALRLLTVLLSVATVLGADSEREPSTSYSQSVIADLENYMASKNVEERLLAQSVLTEQMPVIPSDLLKKLLLAGLADSDIKVRLATIGAVNENARRVARLKGDTLIDTILEKMVSGDIEALRAACRTESDSGLLVQAVCAIASIRYYRDPFVNYCEWETDYLVPLVQSFEASDSAGEKCAAAVLCGYVQAPQNLHIVVEVLKAAFTSDSEKVKQKAVRTVSSFQYSEELLLPKLIVFVGIEDALRGVVDESSSQSRDFAKEALSNLRILLLANQKEIGIVILPKNKGNGFSH